MRGGEGESEQGRAAATQAPDAGRPEGSRGEGPRRPRLGPPVTARLLWAGAGPGKGPSSGTVCLRGCPSLRTPSRPLLVGKREETSAPSSSPPPTWNTGCAPRPSNYCHPRPATPHGPGLGKLEEGRGHGKPVQARSFRGEKRPARSHRGFDALHARKPRRSGPHVWGGGRVRGLREGSLGPGG